MLRRGETFVFNRILRSDDDVVVDIWWTRNLFKYLFDFGVDVMIQSRVFGLEVCHFET